mmetsp:Transcript_82191/g.129905  ORF Transcript_82191/g.129905 Transcript_82191/m.129905 type:complete len:268 (-) Transcript_82191:255-1058(-)
MKHVVPVEDIHIELRALNDIESTRLIWQPFTGHHAFHAPATSTGTLHAAGTLRVSFGSRKKLAGLRSRFKLQRLLSVAPAFQRRQGLVEVTQRGPVQGAVTIVILHHRQFFPLCLAGRLQNRLNRPGISLTGGVVEDTETVQVLSAEFLPGLLAIFARFPHDELQGFGVLVHHQAHQGSCMYLLGSDVRLVIFLQCTQQFLGLSVAVLAQLVKPSTHGGEGVRRVLLDLRQGGAWRDEALAHQGGGVPDGRFAQDLVTVMPRPLVAR